MDITDCSKDIPALVNTLLDRQNPFAPFLPLLKQSDPIPILASSVLSSLLSHAIHANPKHTSAIDDALAQLFTYVSSLSQNSDVGLQDIAAQQYSAVLQSAKARQHFWDQRKHTLNPLIDILHAALGGERGSDAVTLRSGMGSIRSTADSIVGAGVGIQLLYHVLLILWQLSFAASLVASGLDQYVFAFAPLYMTNITTENTISSNSTSPSSASLRKKRLLA